MNQKNQTKISGNQAKFRKHKVLTFFDQSSSHGMTRYYGVVCKKNRTIKYPPVLQASTPKTTNEE